MKFQEGKVKIKLSSDIQVLQSLLGIPPATACIWTGINTGKNRFWHYCCGRKAQILYIMETFSICPSSGFLYTATAMNPMKGYRMF